MSKIPTVSVNQLAALDAEERIDLIDVRTPLEFQEVHASNARNIPLDSLDPEAVIKQRNGTAEQPLYVICRSGSRSFKACQKFIDAGYRNAVSVEGGTQAWDKAGLPVVRGRKAMSLERQVRIAAGLLVLLGAILSYFVHPYFNGIAAIVGAGLMLAGIADSCVMGMMLAKMPWNQVKGEGASCCSR